MDKIKIKAEEKTDYTVISFELNDSISPDILTEIELPKMKGNKGVVLSGRGPIWLYCYLTHYYHPTKFIATYDPRLDGAVIVESHTSEYKIGSILKLED